MNDYTQHDASNGRPTVMDSRTVRRLLEQQVPLSEIIAFASQLEAATSRVLSDEPLEQ